MRQAHGIQNAERKYLHSLAILLFSVLAQLKVNILATGMLKGPFFQEPLIV